MCKHNHVQYIRSICLLDLSQIITLYAQSLDTPSVGCKSNVLDCFSERQSIKVALAAMRMLVALQAGLVEKPFLLIELVLFGASCTFLLAPLQTWINTLIGNKLK